MAGPIDVVRNNITGCLNEDLKQAAEFAWGKASMMFLNNSAAI